MSSERTAIVIVSFEPFLYHALIFRNAPFFFFGKRRKFYINFTIVKTAATKSTCFFVREIKRDDGVAQKKVHIQTHTHTHAHKYKTRNPPKKNICMHMERVKKCN